MKYKRLMSVVISMAITVSMIPVFVSADETDNVPPATETTQEAGPSETEPAAKETEKPAEKKPAGTSESEKETEAESKKPVEPSAAETSETEPAAETEATEPAETEPAETTEIAPDAGKKVSGHSVKSKKDFFDYSGDFSTKSSKFPWDLDEESLVLTISKISGTGVMPDYDNQFNTPWKD